MPAQIPVFRIRFPLLVAGSLLAMHTLLPPSIMAAEQFNCRTSATGGWDCSSQAASNTALPRPVHDGNTLASMSQLQEKDLPKLVTQSKGKALAYRSADYSHLDWVPREKLTAEQQQELAPFCSGAYIEPIRPGINDGDPDDNAPTYVSSKTSRYNQQDQVATAAGDVILRKGSMQIEADQANLLQRENQGELIGNVKLRDKGALVVGDRAEIQLDNGEAQVNNAEYVMHQVHARGSALYAKRYSDNIIRLKSGTFTSCEPGSNAWHLKGNNVTLNPNTGFGTATNATLRVKDIPVFYTPYIYFPISKDRLSGFLPPTFSTSSDNGFTLVTPYYFNLAPNYDATLYPRYMVKRGLQLGGEFRYLTQNSKGTLAGAYLHDKEDDRKDMPESTKDRWTYQWKNTTGLSSRLMFEADYGDVSDPYYFSDMDDDIGIDAPTYLNQRGALTYRGDNFTGQLVAHDYAMASISNITPYARLPQLTLNGRLPYNPGGLQMDYQTEYVRFDRDLNDRSMDYFDKNGNLVQQWNPDAHVTGLARANGTRIHAEPQISLPMEHNWGYLTPSFKYLYTNYDLDLDSTGKGQLRDPSRNLGYLDYHNSVTRNIPVFKLDGGLYFDRQASFAGTGSLQTLEPRFMYLYVPYKDQKNIPIFDTSEYNFSYASLWRDNRFSGRDRIGDANQLSLGATSRFVEPNGFERARVSMGQIYYFRDREVQMPGLDKHDLRNPYYYEGFNMRYPRANQNSSPIALEGQYRFNRDWHVNSEYNWNPNDSSLDSAGASFHYQPEKDPRKILNLAYRIRNNPVRYDEASSIFRYGRKWDRTKQHDISTIWPIYKNWSLIARWQHDYNRNRTLDAFGGVEYDSCCFKVRLINRYWLKYDDDNYNWNEEDKADRGIFLQIVFKGLGGVYGNQVETFIDKGIQGYSRREEQSSL